MSEMAPGWYPDPEGENQQRYWDGDQWADYYQPLAPERPEPHGSKTAVEDYPYLANTTQPPTAPGPISTGGSAPGPTTAWGTPAPPGVYVPDQQPTAGQQWNAGDPTQEFHAGATKGRGGLIAIIVTIVVVLGLLIAGGIMAYEVNGAPSPPPLGTADAVAPPAGEDLFQDRYGCALR
ncbi:MAG TPA: DUF2510 domain-containing protein [Beutenbergiaceae bacterium]|nr:DUF2510 domain-containing protein [Beutenbergiaceae bacterium]